MVVGRVEFLCVQPREVLSVVIAVAVEVLRPSVTEAWMDAFTAGEWNAAQQADVDALLALEQGTGESRRSTGMGIDLDLSRHHDVGLLCRLATHTIHAEGWEDGVAVFSVSDTGDHAWFALTPAQVTEVASRLADAGQVFEDVLSFKE